MVDTRTPTRRHRFTAGGLVVVAVAALFAALVATSADPDLRPVRPEFEPLGPALARLAETASLSEKLVPKATHGREIASATGRVNGSARESLWVTVERITARKGRPKTLLTVQARESTGSDVVRTPWSVSRLIPNEDFVLSSDFSRLTVETTICDERTGTTSPVFVQWTVKREPLARTSYGMVANRGGDATFIGRVGAHAFSPRDGLGSVHVQIWPRKPSTPDPHLRLGGQRRKPVRCPR